MQQITTTGLKTVCDSVAKQWRGLEMKYATGLRSLEYDSSI